MEPGHEADSARRNRCFFLPHRSQRRDEFSKWHETWQDCCLRDSTFFGGSLTVLMNIVTSQIVSKFGAKI